MQPVNFRSFRKKLSLYRQTYRSFLNSVTRLQPAGISKLSAATVPEVWANVDCLTCANCCKKMTPTFTDKDVRRVAAHFNQSPEAFRRQWLKKDRNQDWINKTEPCQFLDMQTNMCSIYEVRPADCSGFPYLSKRNWADYAAIHKQNIDYCPATFKLVEKMYERFG